LCNVYVILTILLIVLYGCMRRSGSSNSIDKTITMMVMSMSVSGSMSVSVGGHMSMSVSGSMSVSVSVIW
jgi:hypothetical protein